MCTSVEGIEAEVEANNFGVQMLLQLLKLSYKLLSHYASTVDAQVTISESGHCPLLLSGGSGPRTFTGSEFGGSTLAVRVHWLKSADAALALSVDCLLYTSPSPRDRTRSRMPSSA